LSSITRQRGKKKKKNFLRSSRKTRGTADLYNEKGKEGDVHISRKRRERKSTGGREIFDRGGKKKGKGFFVNGKKGERGEKTLLHLLKLEKDKKGKRRKAGRAHGKCLPLRGLR